MKFQKSTFLVLLAFSGLWFAPPQQQLFAGTTFVTSTDGSQTLLLCNISSNGTVSNIDLSASATYGATKGTAVDTNGNLYVAYSGDAILKYTTNGASLFASGIGAPNLLNFDNAGNLYGSQIDSIIEISTNGTSSVYAAGIAGLNGFCFDPNGTLFASSPAQIVRITPSGITNVFATASVVTTNLGNISSIGIDGQGNLYAACSLINYGYCIFRLDTNGAPVFSFDGVGGQFGSGQNIAADEATNIISSAVYHRALFINGPFGSVQFALLFANLTYISYTPINESLAVYKPSIIRQPTTQTVAAGSSVTMFSGAAGASPISYQWYLDLTNRISGATNQVLTLTNVSSGDIGQYNVIASNYLGSASSQQAGLNVLPSLAINMVPAISLYGGVGLAYNVQYINMVGPTNAPWTTLATVTLTNSPQFYSDYSAIGQPARFYRSVQVP